MKIEDLFNYRNIKLEEKYRFILQNSKLLTDQAVFIPFRVDENQCKENFISWLKELWIAPTKLKKHLPDLAPFKGIYVPFYVFRVEADVAYTGTRITEREEQADLNEDVREETSITLPHVLIPAVQSDIAEMATKLEHWSFKECELWEQTKLGDFSKLESTKTFDAAKEEASSLVRSKIIKIIKERIGGDRQYIQQKRVDYKHVTAQFVYLPVWVSSYMYNKKTFKVIADGSTGETNAHYPVSKTKYTIFILFLLAVVLFLVHLFTATEYVWD